MTSINVDFNSRGPNGTVRGSLRRAAGAQVGDRVELVDDETRFPARVADIDEANGRVLYEVDWEPAAAPARSTAAVFQQWARFNVANSAATQTISHTSGLLQPVAANL